MSRYAAGHAAATRERLLDLAAATIRARGMEALGVAALMREAGLTHGGFYQHFDSREALLAAAVERMFAATRAPFDDPKDARDPRHRLARFIKAYLSPGHVAAPESGCPLPALAGEAARLSGSAAARYREGAARLQARLATMLTDAGLAEPAPLASSVLAELVGAVALARLAADDQARDSVLEASRRALLARLGLIAA